MNDNAINGVSAKYAREAYATQAGPITTPGKFEGEMIYVPYFWDLALGGFADRDNGKVYGFDITKEDRALFPEIPKRQRTVKLVERSDGFVCEV